VHGLPLSVSSPANRRKRRAGAGNTAALLQGRRDMAKIKGMSIEYCKTCNYGPIAASLAYVIKNTVDLKPEIIPSNDMGAFEIRVDGELIFSKKETGVFPDHGEILRMLSKWKEGKGNP
jgi:selenoprotein W-related protein